MLQVRRKANEATRIICPDGAIITVTHFVCEGTSVRLGFEAPQNYRIERIDRAEGAKHAITKSKFRRIKRLQNDPKPNGDGSEA